VFDKAFVAPTKQVASRHILPYIYLYLEIWHSV